MTVGRLRSDDKRVRSHRPQTVIGPFSGRITAQSQTVTAAYGSAGCRAVVPKGWVLEIEALTMSSTDTTGYTLTGKLFTSAGDQSGSFGTLQTQASVGTTEDTAKPTNGPLTVDATAAEVEMHFTITSGAAGAGNANAVMAIVGWLYEAA